MNKFECDKRKARTNHEKHRIRFTDAARAFNAGLMLTARSPQSGEKNEERNTSIARTPSGRTILIVWTSRAENVRLISVRPARKNEREAFDAYLQRIN
jgi:uncharacterized DUF497 family protein